MSINNKLTNTIKGRRVVGTSNADGRLVIAFGDGSEMTVKTQGSQNSAVTGGSVKAVWQKGEVLTIGFEDGTSWDIHMEEQTSSVMLRDKGRQLEYAD